MVGAGDNFLQQYHHHLSSVLSNDVSAFAVLVTTAFLFSINTCISGEPQKRNHLVKEGCNPSNVSKELKLFMPSPAVKLTFNPGSANFKPYTSRLDHLFSLKSKRVVLKGGGMRNGEIRKQELIDLTVDKREEYLTDENMVELMKSRATSCK